MHQANAQVRELISPEEIEKLRQGDNSYYHELLRESMHDKRKRSKPNKLLTIKIDGLAPGAMAIVNSESDDPNISQVNDEMMQSDH